MHTQQSRYRESRTLVRRLCRLPHESPAEFKHKVDGLRRHFERFNVDTAELCQWMMGLRKTFGDPNQPASFGTLGDFLLSPALDGVVPQETERDRWRLHVFDDVASFHSVTTLGNHRIPDQLRQAMDETALAGPQALPHNVTATRLFERLRTLDRRHRLVLLKSAAEWIVARYARGVENWQRQHAEWEKEKHEWEAAHPNLTEKARHTFTEIFKSLRDPDDNGPSGIRRRSPRICTHDRLRENIDNCVYAGEKGHGPLCWKYANFVKAIKEKDRRFNPRRFWEDANRLAAFCHEHKARPGNALQSPNALARIFPDAAPDKRQSLLRILKSGWNEYLKAMDLNETTAVEKGCLPHCQKIAGDTWEKSKCRWNPHTDLCRQYWRKLAQLDDDTLKLESEYREWRRLYLAGPRKPSFRYPSSRELPMPKVFGDGFHQFDPDRAVLRLRPDDAPPGEWVEFGFIPWPRGYKPSLRDARVTSVHINFIGSRARAGFRFDVQHKTSRFDCTQDDLDELRSRTYPRQAQDQQFIDEARKHLTGSFNGSGPAEDHLRLLAVDLGTKGAHAAVYRGKTHERDVALPIIKIDALYTSMPQILQKDEKNNPDARFDHTTDPRGLRVEHVGRHLAAIAERQANIAAHRETDASNPTIEDHDFRSLKRHVAWMIRDWVRHNAASIIAVAEQNGCDLIVFESLRGVRPPAYDTINEESSSRKRRMAMFAYGRIRRKVTEKAVERGMRVVTAPYFKSSQVCSSCGHQQQNQGRLKKNKREGKFICECAAPSKQRSRDGRRRQAPTRRTPRCDCKQELNSDANAARVLARVFWGEIQLPAAGETAEA